MCAPKIEDPIKIVLCSPSCPASFIRQCGAYKYAIHVEENARDFDLNRERDRSGCRGRTRSHRHEVSVPVRSVFSDHNFACLAATPARSSWGTTPVLGLRLETPVSSPKTPKREQADQKRTRDSGTKQTLVVRGHGPSSYDSLLLHLVHRKESIPYSAPLRRCNRVSARGVPYEQASRQPIARLSIFLYRNLL